MRMYRIGDFSKMSRTTVKTLRYYDEVGLLKPECTDSFTGYRFYSAGQLEKIHRIKALRQIGLSIEEIKQVLAGHNVKSILEKRKAEIIAQLEHSAEQLSRIEFILSGKEEESFMSYQAVIKELPECIVYYKRVKVPGFESYYEIIPAINEECARANPDLKPAVPGYCFCVYLDGEYKERDFNVEFCVAVDRFGKEVGDIKFKKLENVTVVSVMHKGPYSELSKAYAYAFRWIEENGYAVAGNPRESYIDGVWNNKKAEEWLTEIQIPVFRK